MKQRWIVIYYDGNETKAAMIDDDMSDNTVRMPFGVSPEQVADDCVDITAIIEVFDDARTPMVVIDDQEFSLDPDDPAVDEETIDN